MEEKLDLRIRKGESYADWQGRLRLLASTEAPAPATIPEPETSNGGGFDHFASVLKSFNDVFKSLNHATKE